tara:strand:+ start:509 stop:1015 length:507 start_codon:yes stop_codon:yes gene_type:complete
MTRNHPSSQQFVFKLMHILGYAGVIPFAIPAVLTWFELWFGIDVFRGFVVTFSAPYIFTSYSAIILSFMSGTLWVNWCLVESQKKATLAVLVSIFLALSAFSPLLLMYAEAVPGLFCVIVLTLGFISLLWVEWFVGAKVNAYWRMRVYLTALVVMLHLVIITLLFMEL